MKWYHSMYLSDTVSGRAGQLMKEMETGIFSKEIWVICIPPREGDQLEIRRASSLAWHGLWDMIPMIAGLAGSRNEALALVKRISEDCLRERGDVMLRQYLSGTE